MLPIGMGNSNFREIRKEGYYYIDKSLLIRELLQDASKVVLISRPRRFGKTLNLNMCEAFFSDQVPNPHLFDGLAIAADAETMKHHGTFPTISMTFKDLHADSWESCQIKLKYLVSSLYRKFKDRIQPDLSQQSLIQQYLRREAPIELVEMALHLLTELLYESTGKLVYIFIDEYDAPIQDGHFYGYYEKIVTFCRAFFGSVLKDNPYLHQGVLTGVLRIAQESLFSGLNNIQVSTVLDKGYAECFGFTESEARQVLQDFHLSHREQEIRAWYNGYNIGSSTLFNPWSILSVASKMPEALESYWVNTAQDPLIEQLITTKHCISLDDLTTLLSGDGLIKEIQPALSLKSIDGQSIWSLLLFSGYLSFIQKKSETQYLLKLPNREVRFYFERIVRRWIEGPSSDVEPLKKIMVDGNLEGFRQFLTERVIRMVGLGDTGGRSEPENFYHGLVLGLFAYGLDEVYEITSNRDAGLGRYDLQLKPRIPSAPGYIFEFKSLRKGGDLAIAATEAIGQVRRTQYTVELKRMGFQPLWLVGIAFKGKNLAMKWEMEQETPVPLVPMLTAMPDGEKPLQPSLNGGTNIWVSKSSLGFSVHETGWSALAVDQGLALSAMPASEKTLQPGDLPNWFHLAHRRNPDFVGREQDLEKLAEDLDLARISAISPIAVATGLGGIGKTQLVVEFAYRNAHLYPGGVFWLNCAQEQQMADEVAGCGLIMGLFARHDLIPLDNKVHLVTQAWHEDQRLRMLIFDNCEAEEILDQWAPKSRHHHLLVTSRCQTWTLPGLKTHALDTLTRSESVTLLQAQLTSLSKAEAEAIASELADLPLALYLAARYLHTYRHTIDPSAYLSTLRSAVTGHASLRGQGAMGIQPTRHDTHVGRCFELSLNRLDRNKAVDVLAAQLLLHASYFAPGESLQPSHLLATLADANPSEAANEALGRLTELGLLRLEKEDQLSLHRLLGHYTQASHSHEVRQNAEAVVIETLLELARAANESGLPARMRPILAHLRHQAEKHFNEASCTCLSLCQCMGNYLNRIASFEEAERFYRRTLACAEQVYGPEHTVTATSLNHLALLLVATNRLAEAEPLMRRALAIDETSFGADHPNVSIRLNSLALLLQATNRLAEAEPLIRRALTIDEDAFGADQPVVATHLNNLAQLLQAANRLAEAEPLFRRALAIDEAFFGANHSNVSTYLTNLALLLQVTNRTAEAEPLMNRALVIDEGAFGADHPTVALDLNNLAALLQTTNRMAEAEPLMHRALAIDEASFGADHPNVAKDLNNLASLLVATERKEQALSMWERALAIFTASLGEDHPNTKTVQRWLDDHS